MTQSYFTWKDIVNKSLPLRFNDFWLCNVNTTDVRAIFANFKSIPYFWKNVILNWCDFNFKEPENVKDVRSFLGLVNFFGRFIPNLSAKTHVLRQLTKKNALWSAFTMIVPYFIVIRKTSVKGATTLIQRHRQ